MVINLNEIEKFTILELDTTKNALVKLDETAKKILFVVNEANKFVGTITDGDIRRWILKNGDLNSEIKNIMNKNPYYLKEINLDLANEIFKNKKINALPVVDENNNITNIIWLDESLKSKLQSENKIDNLVIIMAGGLGTRLYPYTKILPKPLIPIGETPIVERIINKFNSFGCDKFYLTVNYKKNMIKSYFNELQKDYTVDYIDEDKPLGTGGSLSLLKGKIDKTFFVSNCDILIEADYENILKYHKEKENKITVVSSLKTFTIPYGVFKLNNEGNISEIEEKPEYSYLINTGMYVLKQML